jgi:hypothetical protein
MRPPSAVLGSPSQRVQVDREGFRKVYLRERIAGPSLDDVLAVVAAEVKRRAGTAGTANPWIAGTVFLLALVACWTPVVLLAIWLL